MVPTCPTTEAALQTGLLPTQERQKGRFAKASACELVGFSTNLPAVSLLYAFHYSGMQEKVIQNYAL